MAYSITTESVEEFEKQTRRSAIIARAVFGGLLLAGIVAALAMSLQGPSEKKVCTHMLEVLGRTDVVRCAETMTTVRKRLGPLKYKAYSSCLLEASTAQDIITCHDQM